MGKPRDTKIAILPSTTRKGTTLSTSAALDSPSVISKLVSPPQASNAGTSAESENSSHNCDDASAVLDNDGSLGSFLDATIAKSRQIENTETPNENAATPVNSPESVEYSSDDLDEDYVELDDDFIEKCNATTDARKIKKLLAEHAVRYKLSPDPKFATSPINIRDKDYDFSLDLSHIAIVEKTPFCGTEKESVVEHMTELSTLSGLFSDDIKMRTYFVAKIFPFSLKDDAKTWYNNLPPGSIKSPKELLDVFFRKYFPASAQHAALQRIYNFDQEDGEKLPEAWARFCSLIRAQPDHDLEKHDLLDIFYSGLTIESRAYLDSCAGCVFRKRTPDDAEELLAKIGRNHDDWSTPEPTPTPIVKKRGMIKLNDEDMREAKKSLKEKGIKPEDVKNLPPIEDLCEITPPSSMIEDPLYPEGHPKRVEQDSQLIKTSAPSKKKKKKHKNVVESSEPVNDPNSISISDAETESGNEHEEDNDKNDTPDKEEIEKEPEKPAKNKKYTKEDFIAEKHEEQITYKDLPAEHKKKYDELKAICEAEFIGSFETTRSHSIKLKGDTRLSHGVNTVDLSHSIREPGFSFSVNMARLVNCHSADKAESSHSRGKDKEEAVPRDRPQDDDRRYLTEEEVRSIRYQRPLSVHLLNKYEQQYDRRRRYDEDDEKYRRSDAENRRYRQHDRNNDGHSQKRRVQRLRNLEEAEAQYLYTLRRARPDLAVKIQQTLETKARPPKKVWRPKQAKADAQASADADAETSADTNMVFILPSEFRAPSDEEVSVAQFDCGPRPVIFEKPRDRSYRHLKALYLRGYINGQPVSKMLVDTGAAVNIMPYSMLRRLGHSSDDLIKTNITLSDFNGQASEAKGVLNVELTVGRKTIPTAFFIVDSKSNYAVLLGRDWIHANCCIPSTMHQCIIQWDGDEVEVVQADDSIEISLAAMSVWEADNQEPLSGISLEGCERIEASKNGVRLVLSTGLTSSRSKTLDVRGKADP
ncbi:hypothetical protein QYE76_001337 [Lolium multiflorum]|uniref:Retrotransposon gag domain-containing protein n=1 Tax=Lolium multiflorum TaxID=4521 RepID=A0AAD8RLV4_LOLMU|nr:hypothetical protein QYE76_001337 [Lolium multiflorum]